MKKKIGIIGASGYAGFELIKILSKHEHVELVMLNSQTYKGKPVKSLYPEFQSKLKFTGYSIEEINKLNLDLIFLALPTGASFGILDKLDLSETKIIDLSYDHRFDTDWVYGLPEINKEKLKKAQLVANPGCYATAAILSAYPVKELIEHAVFDSKSGYSGAGKNPCYRNDLKNLKDDILVYSIVEHKHEKEIEDKLDVQAGFTPQVMPFFRGILVTAHIFLKENINENEILKKYSDFFNSSEFVKITKEIPEIKQVRNTNNCILGGFKTDKNKRLVVISVIDNLLKGAAGQAVQNMNLMFNFNETEGLL
ncbi:N-acetyl-gamma-glutamyl-phosphate reductase [Candidatus Woesearchaeota archaeon]|nr:N-acetyl-gamma-glutamyl-phosphate reductase [Candidatus Woesearchaeota archaeon]